MATLLFLFLFSASSVGSFLNGLRGVCHKLFRNDLDQSVNGATAHSPAATQRLGFSSRSHRCRLSRPCATFSAARVAGIVTFMEDTQVGYAIKGEFFGVAVAGR